MSEYSTIKLHYLDMLASGDNKFIVEIMDTFIQHFPAMLVGVQDAILENDWLALKYAAHKAKSPAKFMGMDESWQLLHELEEHAREQQEVPSFAPAYLQRLLSTASLALDEVKQAKLSLI